MAGMFYSLQEALDKLNMTEAQLKEAVADGRLREFRDGPNLLFKVEEVEALAPQAGDEALEEVLEPEALEAEDLELEPLALDAEDAEPAEEELEELQPAEIEAEATESEDWDFADEESADLGPEAIEDEPTAAEPAEAGLSDFDIEAIGDTAAEIPDVEALEAEMAESGADKAAPSDGAADTDEILLAPETGAAMPSDLTDADTAITSMGTNVLGEADTDYDIADDTMAETAIPTGTTPEVPLEEIEEDVNLDSFGSGSGLLDLSLQADDTSLGGILDEIYTAEDDAGEPAEVGAEPGSGVGVAAEAEEMVAEDELAAPEMAGPVGVLAQGLIEAPPDTQSNILGMLLFLPLAIVIYTTVVAVAGVRGIVPAILASTQGFIWYIMGGAAVLALVVAGAAFMLTGERDTSARKAKPPKAKKAKKEKKPKEPKKPKEKKPKKEKKAKKK